MSRKRINPEAPLTASQKNQRYYEKHKEFEKLRNQAYVEKNRTKVNCRRRNYRHQITQEQFDAMLAYQGNACAICRMKFVSTPQIDHDHRCCDKLRSCDNCRRYLLCEDCNLGLGRFKDSPVLLQAAIVYVDSCNRKEFRWPKGL